MQSMGCFHQKKKKKKKKKKKIVASRRGVCWCETGLFVSAMNSVLTILPEHAVLRGLAKHEASFLLSIIGIANILGRACGGM